MKFAPPSASNFINLSTCRRCDGRRQKMAAHAYHFQVPLKTTLIEGLNRILKARALGCRETGVDRSAKNANLEPARQVYRLVHSGRGQTRALGARLAQNFVFTHLFGPALSQSISLFLYLSDPHPGLACWTVIVCIWLFWALPFVYKKSGNLQLSALISVELLAFTSLFGAYFYGG